MSKKILVAKVELEYEANPDNYGTEKAIEMAEIDLANIRDLYDFAEAFNQEKYKITIKPKRKK